MKPLLGERTDRAALSRRLSGLGVRADDPYRGGRIGEVYLMLTMDCNIRCRACSLWGLGGACHHEGYYRKSSAALDPERLLSFIDEVAPLRPTQVTFSGEPLLSPAWRGLAERCRRRDMKTEMTTNGVLLETCAAEVAERFDQVNVSVAAPPEERERLRMGPAGHYQEMVRGLRELCAIRDSRPTRRPVLRLLFEVFDSNVGRLGEVIDGLAGSGIRFDEIFFQHLIFNTPEVLARQERVLRSEFGLSPGLWRGYGYQPGAMDFAELARGIADLRRRHPRVVFSIDLEGAPRLRDYYEGRRSRLGRAFCDAPWTQVNLLPNGDVWTCPDIVLGNIAKSSFEEIWDGPKARALRRRVTEKLMPACRGCFYFYGKEQALAGEASRG